MLHPAVRKALQEKPSTPEELDAFLLNAAAIELSKDFCTQMQPVTEIETARLVQTLADRMMQRLTICVPEPAGKADPLDVAEEALSCQAVLASRPSGCRSSKRSWTISASQWQAARDNQDFIGFLSLYHPAVRKALQTHLDDEEMATLLPAVFCLLAVSGAI